MQEFSIYHLLATIACIALFVWLRIRLFGRLDASPSERQEPAPAAANEAPAQQASISS